MTNNTIFKTADRWNARQIDEGIELRLISEETVMYSNLDVDDMVRLRDWLSMQIENLYVSEQ